MHCNKHKEEDIKNKGGPCSYEEQQIGALLLHRMKGALLLRSY